MDFRTREVGSLVPVSGLLMVASVVFGLGAATGVGMFWLLTR